MRIAIIGAGPAGLAAALTLRQHTVEVFEKSRGVSGRAASRGRETPAGIWRYDHGANYLTAPEGSAAAELLAGALAPAGPVELKGRIWTFDGSGRLAAGDPERDAVPKWTFPDGISRLGKQLAAASGAAVHTGMAVTRLAAARGGWTLEFEDGSHRERFDAVLLTPPAPQSADLLAHSTVEADLRTVLVDGLRAAPYRAQFSAILAFDERLRRPAGDAYAYVNTDGEHPLAWVAFEEDKPGHVPPGCSLLVVQASAGWTVSNYDLPFENVAIQAQGLVEKLFDQELPAAAWTDVQRWRYALPAGPASGVALASGAAHGLYFAGDFIGGRGRIHEALAYGIETGRTIDQTFQSSP